MELTRREKVLLLVIGVYWTTIAVGLAILGDFQMGQILNAWFPETHPFTVFVIAYTDSLFYVIMVLSIIALVVSLVPSAEDLKKKILPVWFAYGVTVFVTIGLKVAISRPRPYAAAPDSFENYGLELSDKSMPSGHSSYSAAWGVGLATRVKNRVLAVVLEAYPMFMMFTRVYLGVHWTTDVLVGSIIGTLLAVFLGKFVYEKLESGDLSRGVQIGLVLFCIFATIYPVIF